jgi:two-component system chemotaxis sensor kinase CheA
MSNTTESLHAPDDEMAEILQSFLVETKELFEQVEHHLLQLEQQPDDKELQNAIFRAVHTVKGTSSFLGFKQLTELAHAFEDLLNKIRKGERAVLPSTMDVILAAFDSMKELLRRIQANNTEPVDLREILESLQRISDEDQVPSAEQSKRDEQAALRETKLVPPTRQEEAKLADTTLRVDIARLDSLMNLVGELVLSRNRLAQLAAQLHQHVEGSAELRELSETSAQIDFVTSELQMAVMKTRMVPIAKVFNKLPRLMRDLCKEIGKEIQLKLEGEETELDKSISDELNDPLVHIVRNAADHGIEAPEERIRAGKPRQGTVVVSAEHEGNNIIITVTDDGRGINPETIKQKAVEKGLITQAEAQEMTAQEAYQLVFEPGFSTASRVTNISGRGVGMDVVRTNITKLKGTIEIDSEVGKGTTLTIKVPLTLAIIQVLLVESCGEVYALPLLSVGEVVRIQPADIETVAGKEVLRVRNTVVPLVRINELFGRRRDRRQADWWYVVIVDVGSQRFGIFVDALLGQREVVIKSLGEYFGTIPGIAGSTILGDGRVIMIVDVGRLCSLSLSTVQQRAPAVHEEAI